MPAATIPQPPHQLDLRQRAERAIAELFAAKSDQANKNHDGAREERGQRGATLGGKHCDGLAGLVRDEGLGLYLPADSFVQEIIIPGTMQRSKKWDASNLGPGGPSLDQRSFVGLWELKTIGSSYGKNINNRLEELAGVSSLARETFAEMAPETELFLGQIFVVIDDLSGELQKVPPLNNKGNYHAFGAETPLADMTLEQRFSHAWEGLVNSERYFDAVALLQVNQGSADYFEPNPRLGLETLFSRFGRFINDHAPESWLVR